MRVFHRSRVFPLVPLVPRFRDAGIFYYRDNISSNEWHTHCTYQKSYLWYVSRALKLYFLQQFASKHKPQTFSRVCLHLKRDVYRWKRNVSLLMWRVIVQSLIKLFFMFWCAFVYVSVFPSSRYCKSDQTCLYSYFLWLERIIMGLEILKRARRHIKTWQLRQK
jgi:hypothetical protein